MKRHKAEPREIEERYTSSPETRDQSRYQHSSLDNAEVRVHGSQISCGTLSSSPLYDPLHRPVSYVPAVSDGRSSVFHGSAIEQLTFYSTGVHERLPGSSLQHSGKSSLQESMPQDQISDSYYPGNILLGSTLVSQNCDDVNGVGSGSSQSPQPSNVVGDSVVRRDFSQLHNETASESRSRTPSLHVHTNSTKSVNASTSPPQSPLTELEPSSPNPESVKYDSMVIEGDIPQVFGHTARPRKQVRSHDTMSTESVAKHDRQSFARIPSQSTLPSKSQPTINGNGQKVGRNGTRDFKNGIYRSTPSTQGRSNIPTMSVQDDEEDESIRLVRQLTEQDFGLRRRSK